MKKIALINHGCAKNLVDSELMLGLLTEAGFDITLDETQSDIVIINTCSFIADAETESVQSILKMIEEGKKVIITGCLPQKHKMEMHKVIPEAVAMLGTSDIKKIVEVVKKVADGNEEFIYEITQKPDYLYPEMVQRQQITVGASCYLKIADGCNAKCGYCIIPQLRGEYHSRPIENILEEAKCLAQKGVSEIILIAQDTTSYGIDIYGKPRFTRLLQELEKIKEIQWLRIMYTYPSMISDDLIQTIKNSKKIVKYLDIPLQHSHPEILKSMRRPLLDYKTLIDKIRNEINGIAIRTTFIVGYPGEEEEHFSHLKNFIKEIKFDKLGVFEYSREPGTDAYDFENQISQKVKAARKNELMTVQQEISKEINESFIGKQLPTIIEMITQEGDIIGRTYRDAPEIDGVIYVKTEHNLIPGDIVDVEVTSADEYDMWGLY